MAKDNQIQNAPALPEDSYLFLRRQLVASFHDEHVHGSFEKIFAGIPPDLRGIRPEGQPFTLWRILEHLRLCVLDFLNACRASNYAEPRFPEGYWPEHDAPASDAAWEASLAEFQCNMKKLEDLILDPATDLFAPFPGGNGRNVLRQALACLDHNAYHLGEAVLLRRFLGVWKP